MKRIDGSYGEGGGQILRSSLSLSALTGQAVEIVNVRAGRKKPGLLKQHLCAVKAAASICGGSVEGAELGSGRVRLEPGPVRPGEHHFAIGSAGSASLVLQTVLPPLLVAESPSRVVVEGGTHNPGAPPFEFLDRVFCPALRSMGAEIDVRLDRAGFFPTGGGRIVADIRPPAGGLGPLRRVDRGALVRRHGWVVSSGLPAHVARRERRELQDRLGGDLKIGTSAYEAFGVGNAVLVEQTFEHASAVFVGFGARGKASEKVAADAARQAVAFAANGAAVDEYLADQLLLPMAIGQGGAFSTVPLSLHSTTNIEVIREFVSVSVQVEATPQGAMVEVIAAGAALRAAPATPVTHQQQGAP